MKKNALRLIVLLLFAALLIWLASNTDARQLARDFLLRIEQMGPWAPFWFVVAYVIACLTFFPGVILTMAAGILFGVIKGTFLVTLGASLGAGCAFLISRYLAREWVSEKISAHRQFRSLDDAVEREGWKIVGLTRLSPAFPFIPMNFFFGLTKVPFWQFFFVTWISVVPMTALFVYVGTLIGDLAAVGTHPAPPGRTKWVITAIALASAIIVTVLIARILRRSLRTYDLENQGAAPD